MSATVAVTQAFDAPAERVFDAWLDTAMLGRWMFGLAFNDEIVRIAIDPRVGGAFSFLIRRDGPEIDHIGKYIAIERPRRLSFTWAIAPQSPEPGVASRVDIAIMPADNGCVLTLTHEIPDGWEQYADRTRMGWTRILVAQSRVLSGDDGASA